MSSSLTGTINRSKAVYLSFMSLIISRVSKKIELISFLPLLLLSFFLTLNKSKLRVYYVSGKFGGSWSYNEA